MSNQFQANEVTTKSLGGVRRQVFYLERSPIIEGTVTGTIYLNEEPIQCFYQHDTGKFVVSELAAASSLPRVRSIAYAPDKGELWLEWTEEPGPNYAVVSYEYHDLFGIAQEAQTYPDSMFETFFSHEDILDMMTKATYVAHVDNNYLGNNPVQRAESLYLALVSATSGLIRSGESGYFWIVCPPEIAALFNIKDVPLRLDQSKHRKMGNKPQPECLGILNQRWRVYSDSLLDNGRILIGANSTRTDNSNFALLNIANYWI